MLLSQTSGQPDQALQFEVWLQLGREADDRQLVRRLHSCNTCFGMTAGCNTCFDLTLVPSAGGCKLCMVPALHQQQSDELLMDMGPVHMACLRTEVHRCMELPDAWLHWQVAAAATPDEAWSQAARQQKAAAGDLSSRGAEGGEGPGAQAASPSAAQVRS